MNNNNRMKDAQNAQGMVEFALVLPILMLVILGVFAFGHMFFVYSSVVSASREAARWGAAVGDSTTAGSTRPRYQDCTSIRAAAVRVGAFAGVGPESVQINYDHGPETTGIFDGTGHEITCAGTVGPNSSEVRGGDRIVVRVTVNYTPIVPLVNLPSFPITAETGRTIIKSVSVGDAPAAEDLPNSVPSHVLITPDKLTSKVGEPVVFHITVTADSGPTPSGVVTYTDSDGLILGPSVLVDGQADFPVTFQSASEKYINVAFGPDNEIQALSEQLITYIVEPADTSITINDPNDPSQVGNEVAFAVQLAVTAPGAVTTSGPVGETPNISASGGRCTPLTNTLMSTCTFSPNQTNSALSVTVRYPGSANYKASEAVEVHTVNRKGVDLTVRPEHASIPLGSPAVFVVQVIVPSNGTGVAGQQVVVNSGDGSCTVTLVEVNSTTFSGSCSFTPRSGHGSLNVVANYPGSAVYDATTAVTSIAVVAPVEETPYCPSFESDTFDFRSLDTFTVNVRNPGPYNMRISSVTVSWPQGGVTSNLWEVRFHRDPDVFAACDANDQDQCVWWANNPNRGLQKPAAGPLTVSSPAPSGSTWVGNGNPGIASDTTRTLLFKFTADLEATGPYSLSVNFTDGTHTCTTDPVIDFNR